MVAIRLAGLIVEHLPSMVRNEPNRLVQRGLRLEYATLGWNVVGLVVLGWSAIVARSVALAGFGLDSLIEIGASVVVVWELTGSSAERERRALRLIAWAFVTLALYLLIQSSYVLAVGHRARHSAAGIAWTAMTAGVMFGLACARRALELPLTTRCFAPRAESLLSTAFSPRPCSSASSSTPPSAGGGRIPPPGTSSSTTRSAK
jgi:hypothetical protein